MSLPRIDPVDVPGITLLLGKQGSGKTYAAINLVLEARRGRFVRRGKRWDPNPKGHRPRVIAYDPAGDMGALCDHAAITSSHHALGPAWWPPDAGGAPLILLLDEAHDILHRRRDLPAWFATIAPKVRHYGIAMVLCSQNPAQLHPWVADQATAVWAGVMSGASNLGWIHSSGFSYPRRGVAPQRFIRLK